MVRWLRPGVKLSPGTAGDFFMTQPNLSVCRAFVMRKIETEMVAAVWNHHEWRKANTRVEIKGPHAMVFLHGNHIATLNRFDKCLEFYAGPDSRWFSRTTFSRLNALALQFCGFRPFYTKRHVPMIKRRRDDSTGDREWTLRDFYSFNASGC